MNWLHRTLFPRRHQVSEAADNLYSALLAKAREPDLFSRDGLPDTLEGRFHAIALYAAILFPVLENAGPKGADVSQRLYKRIFESVDAGLRETGVGDASIARKVRRMGESFFGIGRAVKRSLESPTPIDAVSDVLERNAIAPGPASRRVAERIVAAAILVHEAPADRLIEGIVDGWNSRQKAQ